jgi:hypothetical protein
LQLVMDMGMDVAKVPRPPKLHKVCICVWTP